MRLILTLLQFKPAATLKEGASFPFSQSLSWATKGICINAWRTGLRKYLFIKYFSTRSSPDPAHCAVTTVLKERQRSTERIFLFPIETNWLLLQRKSCNKMSHYLILMCLCNNLRLIICSTNKQGICKDMTPLSFSPPTGNIWHGTMIICTPYTSEQKWW